MIPTTGTPDGECYVTLSGIIEVFMVETTDVDTVTTSNVDRPVKIIKNGTLYIQANDKIYDVLGVQISR